MFKNPKECIGYNSELFFIVLYCVLSSSSTFQRLLQNHGHTLILLPEHNCITYVHEIDFSNTRRQVMRDKIIQIMLENI